MRTRFLFLPLFCFVVVWGLVGCAGSANEPSPTAVPPTVVAEMPTAAPAATAVPEATVDPATAVVMNMLERVNAEDYAGAAEFLADDMMAYLIGMPPTGMEIYWGKEQFQTFLQECCTGANFVWEVAPERVEDGVVYTESKTWMDFTRELGVAPNTWHELFMVRDGKITLYVSTITEEALATFKPVIFEAVPELATAVQPPAATDDAPVSEVAITITNGTCAYDGPMVLQAGNVAVNVVVQDQTWDKYAVSFFTLAEDKDLLDLMASTYNPGPPTWASMVFIEELAPGDSQSYPGFSAEEGLLYMVCWGGSPDTAIGNAGPFVVTP